MFVTKTTNHIVNKCAECPYIFTTMDGPMCDAPGAPDTNDALYVYPEGRNEIHPDCPIKEVT